MPLGIVPDSLFDEELALLQSDRDKNKDSAPAAVIIDKETPGRNNGDKNVPREIQKVIAEEHTVNGRKSAVALAESFGISHEQVDAYKNGATSTSSYNKPNPDLKAHLDKVRSNITGKASSRLLLALDSITNKKLEETKPRDAAGIAKDMSVIIRNMEPEVSSTHIGPNFVFYSPVMKKEKDFDVIDIGE